MTVESSRLWHAESNPVLNVRMDRRICQICSPEFHTNSILYKRFRFCYHTLLHALPRVVALNVDDVCCEKVCAGSTTLIDTCMTQHRRMAVHTADRPFNRT